RPAGAGGRTHQPYRPGPDGPRPPWGPAAGGLPGALPARRRAVVRDVLHRQLARPAGIARGELEVHLRDRGGAPQAVRPSGGPARATQRRRGPPGPRRTVSGPVTGLEFDPEGPDPPEAVNPNSLAISRTTLVNWLSLIHLAT